MNFSFLRDERFDKCWSEKLVFLVKKFFILYCSDEVFGLFQLSIRGAAIGQRCGAGLENYFSYIRSFEFPRFERVLFRSYIETLDRA